jgi:putative ABC transport system ATP-binding protein
METKNVLTAKNLKKYYTRGSETVKALDGIDIELKEGEIVSVVGPSGSGKTTLMNLISCLDTPTSGSLTLGEKDVSLMGESQLIAIRRSYIGFIFQQFFLIPNLSPSENVELPLIFSKKKTDQGKIQKLLESVGLQGKEKIPSYMLSGGDKQRVAIARALVNDPKILIADEPTGKLEIKVRDQLLEIFKQLAKNGMSIFIATHDLELASMTQRIIHLQDGKVVPKEESTLYG